MKRLATILVLFSAIGARAGDLKLAETDDTIRITLRGKPVLEYVKTARPVPDGIAKHFSRSGYIHPVFSPTGQEVTGDYPPDHAHQHALFFAWTKATFDGSKVDFWNQAKQLGGVEYRGPITIDQKDDRVSFTTRHAFTVGTGDARVDALHEAWTVTVHLSAVGQFLFDIESVQECATDLPLILPEYHYGGMALRGNSQWLHEKDDRSRDAGDFRFVTSDGKDRLQGNHTRPNWVALTGRIDDQDVSVAVFCSPRNFRAPQHVRLHPDKPYFCFAPMVAGKFEIAPGEKYISRYRYLVTSKPADAESIDRHWRSYAASEKR